MRKRMLRNKKMRYLIVAAVAVPLAVFILLLSLNIVSSLKKIKNGSTSQASYNISNYDYFLRDNATRLQKKYFQELEKELSKKEIDDNKVAEIIVKNFVADMYTWNNKAGSYDVGGVYYLYSPLRANLYLQARNRFYVNFNHYKNEAGLENLLEVEEVTTEFVDNNKFSGFDGQAQKFFRVLANWKYKDHDKFDESKFTTKGEFYLIKNNDGRFEIIVGWE